jgi:pyrroloquinoline quinone biosynthesis protein A
VLPIYSVVTTFIKVEFQKKKGDYIMWTTPSATEMRFGFEVTMYVMNK